MAMKINELMIGDWVYNKHHKKNIQIQPYDFFVHGHGNNGTFAVSSTIVSGRDLVPIPLTEEILEKNGLQKLNDKTFLLKNQIEIEVGTKFSEVSARYEDYDRDYNSYNNRYIEIAIIHYVHELQHLLRLCGVEKELTI